MDPYSAARLAIAICKAEVEKVIGQSTLDALDGGSPWGRAYLRFCNEVQQATESQPDTPAAG